MHGTAGNGDELRIGPVAVLAENVDPALVREARVDHDTLAGSRENACAVGPKDVRQPVRRCGQALAKPDVDVVERRGA